MLNKNFAVNVYMDARARISIDPESGYRFAIFMIIFCMQLKMRARVRLARARAVQDHAERARARARAFRMICRRIDPQAPSLPVATAMAGYTDSSDRS